MDVETFCSAITPMLKASGFKKRCLNWQKDQGASIAVFDVQISAWGDRSYYLNAGVYLKASGAEPAPPHNRWHVQERLNHESPGSVVSKAIEWFAVRADIEALTKLHSGGRLSAGRARFWVYICRCCVTG
jgi:hypothetical protein